MKMQWLDSGSWTREINAFAETAATTFLVLLHEINMLNIATEISNYSIYVLLDKLSEGNRSAP